MNEILIFTRVVQAASFTAAARQLAMPKSTVSRKVSELEQRLGARLLQRNTRKLSLTDAGRTFFARCERIVQDAEDAERAVASMQQAPAGLLRVTAPVSIGMVLGPMIATFLQKYPQVQLELECTDRVVDLLDTGFDLALRIGVMPDSSLVARLLASESSILVASPIYLQQHGAPTSPAELTKHNCLLFGANSYTQQWLLERDGEVLSWKVGGSLRVNDTEILYCTVLAGVGIALLPKSMVQGRLETGQLQQLLTDWISPPTNVQVVYPSARLLSAKEKAFIEHLQQSTSFAFGIAENSCTRG